MLWVRLSEDILVEAQEGIKMLFNAPFSTIDCWGRVTGGADSPRCATTLCQPPQLFCSVPSEPAGATSP